MWEIGENSGANAMADENPVNDYEFWKGYLAVAVCRRASSLSEAEVVLPWWCCPGCGPLDPLYNSH